MAKFKGRKVLVVGFGRSGIATTKYLASQGAKVTVTDMAQRSDLSDAIDEVADYKVEFELGRHNPASFETADLIVLSPGVPRNIKPLEDARARGVPITSETELAAGQLKEPLIAVTGTNGKTTAVTVLGEMFKADNKDVFVGGNNGNPMLNHVIEGKRRDAVVAELSSFQLELMEKYTPAVAVFTNVQEDHMDRYPDFESYIQAKKRLLRVCDRNTYVILNFDDPIVSRFAEETAGKVIWFTKKSPLMVGGDFAEQFCGAYLSDRDKKIIVKVTAQEEEYDISKLRLFGMHNRENMMASILAARMMGVSPAAIQKVIEEFPGVPHRLEFLKKKAGVFFFNDSKGTNVMSLKRSLEAFKVNPIILIAGGKDKDADFTPLVPLIKDRCKILVLMGEAKEKMNRAIGDFAETYMVGTFEEGVLLAYQKSRSGDIVLLSPGCASYDMFRNFEERGKYFTKLVSQL